MTIIEKVTLVDAQPLSLSFSNHPECPHLDASEQQTQDYDTDVLYDADFKQTTARPAVAQTAGTVLFTVQISGIPSNLMGQELRLQTDDSQSFWSTGMALS